LSLGEHTRDDAHIMTQGMSRYKRATGLYAINAKDNQDETNEIDEPNEINKGIQLEPRASICAASQGKSSCSNVQALDI